MADRVRVQVPKCREELLHNLGGLSLIQVLILDDVMEELAALAVLDHEEAHLVPLPDLKELDDVGMVLSIQSILVPLTNTRSSLISFWNVK